MCARRRTHFLCFAKESQQRKATPLPATRSVAAGDLFQNPASGVRANSLRSNKHGPFSACGVLKQARAEGTQGVAVRERAGSGLDFGFETSYWVYGVYRNIFLNDGLILGLDEAVSWQRRELMALAWASEGADTCVAVSLSEFSEQAVATSPNSSKSPMTARPHSIATRIPFARAEKRSAGRKKGRALFERSKAERVSREPRPARASQGARSGAEGHGQSGRLFFAYFLLAKQKKVSALPGASPGSPSQHTAGVSHSTTHTIFSASDRPGRARS